MLAPPGLLLFFLLQSSIAVDISDSADPADSANLVDPSEEGTGRWTGVQLGTDSSVFGAIFVALALILPVAVLLIILDFAIFGAVSKKIDERSNPVSRFFYHVRNGADIVRSRNNYGWVAGAYGRRPPNAYYPAKRYYGGGAAPEPYRVARSLEDLPSVVNSIESAQDLYGRSR